MGQALERDGAALKVLGRRVNRVRAWTAAIYVVGGLDVDVTDYWALRELQLEIIGFHVPYLTGAVTVGGALAATGIASKLISRLLIRQRARAWVEEVSVRHEVAAEPLRQFLDLWR